MRKDNFKTILTDTTLVDILMVLKTLPQDEVEQIEAFANGKLNAENMAVQIISSPGPKWTCRVAETGEPLVVAGFFKVGAKVWRSFMLANERAWGEHAMEITIHCRKAMRLMQADQEHIRLETLCLAKRRAAQEWYPKIGLKYESTLHGYGVNGESAVMYSATKGARNG